MPAVSSPRSATGSARRTGWTTARTVSTVVGAAYPALGRGLPSTYIGGRPREYRQRTWIGAWRWDSSASAQAAVSARQPSLRRAKRSRCPPLAKSEREWLTVADPLRDPRQRRPRRPVGGLFGGLQLSNDGTQTIIVGLLPDAGTDDLLGPAIRAPALCQHDPNGLTTIDARDCVGMMTPTGTRS